MHFELEQRLTEQERTELEEESIPRVLGDAGLKGARLRADAGRGPTWWSSRRPLGRPYPTGRGGRDRRLPRLAAPAELRAARLPRVRARRPAGGPQIRAVPGSAGSASCPTSTVGVRGPDAARLARPDLRPRIEDGDLLVFSKTNAYSTVHRRARMDYIGVRKVNPDGEIVGEARMIGLFTSKAYMEPAAKTPLLSPQARADPRGRGPDPGLARLQGGGRALRVVPQGRAVPSLDR